ncbi:hypothetical protein HDV02_000157 [Globomyces sp. JEL0801]|nr:hypothetical protein HDV02_000157 [Globomyces sp. JEL0801]
MALYRLNVTLKISSQLQNYKDYVSEEHRLLVVISKEASMDHLTVAIKAAYDSTQAYYQSPYTKISLFMNIRNNHGSLIPFNLRVKDCFDPLDHIECVVLPQGISKRKASTDVSNKQNNGSKKSKTEKTLLEMSESEYESEDDISANKNNVAPAAETFNEKTADKITHKVANTVKHNIKEVEEDEESSEEDVQDADAQESESDNDQSDDEDVESKEQEESDEEESDEEVEESGKEEENANKEESDGESEEEEEEVTEQEPEEESEDEVAETEPQVESEEESEEEEPAVEDQVESEDESEEEEVEKPAEKAESESEEESSEEEVAESADESEEGDVEANDEADSEEASEDEDEKVNDESESEEESEEEVKAVDEAESEEEAEVEDEKVIDEAESEEESEEEDVEAINEAESEEESEEEEVKANTEAESEEESEEEDVKANTEAESEEESEVENVETKEEAADEESEEEEVNSNDGADLENESEEEEEEEVKANDEEESEEEPEEVESNEKILEGIVSDVTDIAESDEEELHEDEKMTNVGLSSGQSQVPDSDEKLESGKDVEMEESDSDKVMDVDQDRSGNATDSNMGDNEETGQTVESEVAVQKKDLETVEYQQNTDLAGEIEHSTQDKEIDGMQEKSNNEFDFELLGGDSAQKQNKKAVTYSKKPIRTPHDRVTRSAKSRSSSANSNLEIMEEDIFSKMNGDVEPRASNGADSVKQLKEKYLSEEPTQKEHNLRSNKAQQELNALEDIEAVEEIETEISLKESNTTSTNSMGMDVSGSPLSSNRNDESSQVLNVRDGYKSIGQPKPICFGSDDEDEDVSYKPKTIDISKVQSKRMTQSSPCSPGKVNKRLSQFSIPNALTDTNEIQVVMDSEEDEPMFSKASISTGELLCEPRVTEIAETETEPDSQVYSQVFASQPFNATQLKVDLNPRNCLSDIKNHTGNNFVDRSTKSMSFHSLFEFDSVVNKAKSPVKAPAVLSDDSSDSDDSDDTSTSEEENHGNSVRLAGKRKRKRKSILLQLAKTVEKPLPVKLIPEFLSKSTDPSKSVFDPLLGSQSPSMLNSPLRRSTRRRNY